MKRLLIATIALGVIVSSATAQQGGSMFQSQLAQSQARVDRLSEDLLDMDARIENNVNELVKLLSTVQDSPDTGTQIVNTQIDVMKKLKNSIDVYQRERNKITGAGTAWQRTPTAAQQQQLDEIAERQERRIEQVVQLASSLATHQDFEKYTIQNRTQIRNQRRTVSDEYRSNRRVTARSEPARERVVEKGTDSVQSLENRAAELQRQISMSRNQAQRAALESELAEVNELLSTRRSQVDALTDTYPPNTRPVSRDEASDIREFVDDEVRQIREDIRRMQLIKSDLDHERNRLRSLQFRAGG